MMSCRWSLVVCLVVLVCGGGWAGAQVPVKLPVEVPGVPGFPGVPVKEAGKAVMEEKDGKLIITVDKDSPLAQSLRVLVQAQSGDPIDPRMFIPKMEAPNVPKVETYSLGLLTEGVSQAEKAQLKVGSGVWVREVTPQKPGATLGMKVGDLVTAYEGEVDVMEGGVKKKVKQWVPLETREQFEGVINEAGRKNETMKLRIVRGGKQLEPLWITPLRGK